MKWFKSPKEGRGTPADTTVNIKFCCVISAFLRCINEIFVLLGLLGPWRWDRQLPQNAGTILRGV